MNEIIMETPLRWGICTAGRIAHDFVASLQGHEDQHKVVAVAARSRDRAAKFADDLNIPTAYGSYEELANDPDVDVVYVASINTEHLKHCTLFMSHKKHVLCEKPSALTQRDTQKILKAAKENDVFFLEGYWTAFFPACEKIREIIASGHLGDVVSLIANHGQQISQKERVARRDLGGGALYDLGCYLVYMVTMVFGKAPLSTYTHGFLNADGVDESYTTTMMFLGGAIASLTSSSRVEYPNDVTIVGTKGRLRIPDHFHHPTSLEWTNEHGESTFFEFTLPLTEAEFVHGEAWSGLYYEAEAVRLALNRGLKEHSVIPWRDTQLIARLLDQARHDLRVTWDNDDTNININNNNKNRLTL